MQNNYTKARRLAEQFVTVAADTKSRRYRRCRSELSREIVRISLIIRNLGFTPSERKGLTERVNRTMELMRSLGRQLDNRERRLRTRPARKSRRTTARRGESIVPR
jgi:hypothetical protein